MKSKIPFYLLMIFIVASILYIFATPIFIIDKIEKDSKKPKNERSFEVQHTQTK